MNSNKKIWIALVAVAAIVGLGLWLRAKNVAPEQPVAQTFDSEKYEGIPQYDADLGRYYDYQFATGALADQIRELISVPLVLTYKDEAINILLRDIEWEEQKAVLHIRDNIYWSDGKPLHAQHIVDTYQRFVRHTGTTQVPLPEGVPSNIRQLAVHAEGSLRVVIAGFETRPGLVAFLASPYMRPYRGDLGRGDQDLDAAFAASLGPYRIEDVGVKTMRLPAALTLPPNDVYYRGPKQEPYALDLVPFFPPPQA